MANFFSKSFSELFEIDVVYELNGRKKWFKNLAHKEIKQIAVCDCSDCGDLYTVGIVFDDGKDIAFYTKERKDIENLDTLIRLISESVYN